MIARAAYPFCATGSCAWFIAMLLLLTLLYTAWRRLTSSRSHTTHRPGTAPSTGSILGFIVALSLLSFVVRLWWPLGWWWTPPWWLRLFGLPGTFLPQFLSLFILGCLAYRHNWFVQLTPRMGRDWSLLALVATLVSAFFIVLNWALGMPFTYFAGGFHWQALGEDMWETFVVVGACLGLLILFRQRWNRQGSLAKGLAASSYTIYLIHPLVLVAFASALQAVSLYPLLKFVIAVLITLPLCFLVGFVIRKLPLASKIL